MGQLTWGLMKAAWCLLAFGALMMVMGFQFSLIVGWWIVGGFAGFAAYLCERYSQSLQAQKEREEAFRLMSEVRMQQDRIAREHSEMLSRRILDQTAETLERVQKGLSASLHGSGGSAGACQCSQCSQCSQESSPDGEQGKASQRTATTARQRPNASSQGQGSTESQGQTRRPL